MKPSEYAMSTNESIKNEKAGNDFLNGSLTLICIAIAPIIKNAISEAAGVVRTGIQMDIARSEGEDLSSLDTQLACLQVFALGGKTKHDNSLDTGYFATRVALNAAVKGSSSKLVEGLLVGTSQPLLRLIAAVASRFSIQVTEKFVAQAVPVIGALGGGAINLAFIQHFQNMAEAHFSIRRLEREYGEESIRIAYENSIVKH